MRKARVCYGHLAGELGVMVYERPVSASGSLTGGAEGPVPERRRTGAGFAHLGSTSIGGASERRVFCRPCVDWGERRDHLTSALGAALLQRIYELRWANTSFKDSRVVDSPQMRRAEPADRRSLDSSPK